MAKIVMEMFCGLFGLNSLSPLFLDVGIVRIENWDE